MKIARQIAGLAAACSVGIILPLLAILYDAAYRFPGSLASAWHNDNWRHAFFSSAIFIAEGSVFCGLIAGGLGIRYLRLRRYTAFKHYLLAGGIIGAACGTLFSVIFNMPGDSWIAWPIFIVIPALSTALGFTVYWFICVRLSGASEEELAPIPKVEATR